MIPTDAATALIRSFGRVSGRAHSVWVRTEVIKDTGAVRTMICVARSPTLGQALKVPTEWKGFQVREMPWGRVHSEPSE